MIPKAFRLHVELTKISYPVETFRPFGAIARELRPPSITIALVGHLLRIRQLFF